jgi:hypothetical protein
MTALWRLVKQTWRPVSVAVGSVEHVAQLVDIQHSRLLEKLLHLALARFNALGKRQVVFG